MILYTIIKYRSSHSNYYGSRRSYSHSDIDFFITIDKKQAINQGILWQVEGDKLSNDSLNNTSEDYDSTEIFVAVNGWMGYQQSYNLEDYSKDNIETVDITKLEEEREEILEQIRKESELKILELIGEYANTHYITLCEKHTPSSISLTTTSEDYDNELFSQKNIELALKQYSKR